MPYVSYPPSILALPLEVRCLIYSHLIYQGSHVSDTNIPNPDEVHRTVRNTFLVCRQIHREAFEYYYSNNSFLLSLVSPYYSLKEVVARSDTLLARMRFVQSLHLIINTINKLPAGSKDGELTLSDIFRSDSQYPKQQEQWICFLNLLAKAKEGRSERKLKELIISDGGICCCKGVCCCKDEEFEDAKHVIHRSLLAPIRGEITQIKWQRALPSITVIPMVAML